MLSFRDVRKSFGGVHALDGVSFGCARGEVLGLLGPNGAGKSTAIAIGLGIESADSGSVLVEVDGVVSSPSDPRVRSRLGVATHHLAVYPGLTGLENLAFFATTHASGRLSRREARACAAAALERLGLGGAAGRRVRSYSEGMKRRLNLAAAIVHEPEVVLLDEPTVSLDPHGRRDVLELVRGLRDRGCAVIYTTHHMDEVERLCDRVVLIHRGRVLAEGTASQLIEAHGRGSGGGADDAVDARLESVFLSLTGVGAVTP